MSGSWVYIVEDEAPVRDSLSLLLQLRGFSTAAFDSAEAFLEGDALERPACVLADVRLPGMSGLELQRRLASQHAALPVVVMTAHGDVATARAALRDGAVLLVTGEPRAREAANEIWDRYLEYLR